MTDQHASLSAKALIFLTVCWLPFAAAAEGDNFSIVNTITRIQMRHTVDENNIVSFTASSFLQAKNRMYVLAVMDYQNDKRQRNTNGRLEINLGGPILESPVGWVVRGRSYYKEDSAAAMGLQFNFNEIPSWKPALKKAGITTFVQMFRNHQDPYFGDSEILHYYSIDIIPNQLALRGYNVFNKGGGMGFVRNSWADLIYSNSRKLDIYYRIVNVSHDNKYLGQAGTTHYLGLRVNFY